MRAALIAAVVLLSFIVLAFASYERSVSAEQARMEVCRRTNQTRLVLRQIIFNSDASLGQPGSPGYAYYKRHPAELRAAHRANVDIISRLAPADCS